jgi:hypothetical protein
MARIESTRVAINYEPKQRPNLVIECGDKCVSSLLGFVCRRLAPICGRFFRVLTNKPDKFVDATREIQLPSLID